MHKQYWLFLRSLRHGAVLMGPLLCPNRANDYTSGGAHTWFKDILYKIHVYYFALSFYILRVGTLWLMTDCPHLMCMHMRLLILLSKQSSLFILLYPQEFRTQHHLKRSDCRPSICLIVHVRSPSRKLCISNHYLYSLIIITKLHHQTR